jgi:hypothetical protein
MELQSDQVIDSAIQNMLRDVDVPVSIISLNGKELSAPVNFRYLSQCKRGYFCPGGSLMFPCPIGAFCPLDGMLDFMMCPPGTFQPRSGSQTCVICPSGTLCPDYGMVAPTMCPAGWQCDVSSAQLPSSTCPPGTFCLQGSVNTSVALLDQLMFNAWLAQHAPQGGSVTLPGGTNVRVLIDPTGNPVPYAVPQRTSTEPLTPTGQLDCPFSTYCFYGTGSETPVFEQSANAKFGRPRYCLTSVVCSSGSSRSEASPVGTVPAGFWAP